MYFNRKAQYAKGSFCKSLLILKNPLMTNNENLLSSDLQVDAIVQNHLLSAAKWAKLLGVLGFIFSGILLLVTGLMGLTMSAAKSGNFFNYDISAFINSGVGIIMLLIINLICFIVALYNYRFGLKMKKGLQNSDQPSFTESLANLAKNYRLIGIITVINFILIVLGGLLMMFLFSFSRA